MFKRIVCMSLSLFLVPTIPARSEVSTLPGVVVTASPWAEPEETVTQDLRVITREEIEAKGAAFVTDLLRGQPGLHLAQSGGTGKNTSIFLRGGSSAQVLVLIDGVKINSPSTGSVDISGIATSDIERIEIIKGPQSTLYGSEAMAGVINIITRQGADQSKVSLTTEAGSYRTVKNTATFAGAGDLWNYRLTADRFDTDGISVAKSGSERDGYQKSAVSSRIRLTPTEQAELGLNLRYSRDRSELDGYDQFTFAPADDLNYLQKRDNYLISVDGKIHPTEHYEQSLTLSLSGERYRTKDPDSEIDTDTRIADWRHTFDFAPATVTAGFNFRREAADFKESFDESTDNRAAYLNGKLRFFDDSLILDGGIRHDSHETFGDHTTYRAGFLYRLESWGTRFKGNYGTGFHAPSLNDLYLPFWGNENLQPEKSRSFDAGIEQEFLDGRLVLGAGWFRQRYHNLIQGNAPTYTADNIGRARSEGWEFEATLTPTDNLTLNAAFTTMDPVDLENDVRLDRRPKKTANASVEYRIAAFLLGADYRYVGDRFDKWAPDPRLPSYSLVDLRLSYDLNPTVTLFARVNNLLDKDHQEVAGYETPDAAVYAGLRASF